MPALSSITPVWVLRTQALEGATTHDVLFSNVDGWFTAVSDTPSATGVIGGLETPRSQVMNGWVCLDTSRYIDPGGLVKVDRLLYRVRNPRQPDGSRPLDDLNDYDWKQQLAELWIGYPVYSPGGADVYSVPTFANFTRLFKGEVKNQARASDHLTFEVRTQIDIDMSKPLVPVVWLGLGGKIKLEKKAGDAPVVERPAATELVATTDQTYMAMLEPETTPSGSADEILIQTPLFRVRCNESGGVGNGHLECYLLNNSSVWQQVGNGVEVPLAVGAGQSDTTLARKALVVAYNSSTNLASLFVNGVADGTTTITGGLDSSASSTAATMKTPNNLSNAWYLWHFRHMDELLTDTTEIANLSMYGIPSGSESRFTMLLEFVDRFGTAVTDFATGGHAATIKNHTSADDSWESTYTGESSMAFTRPAAKINNPFQMRLSVVDAAYSYYQAGWEGLDNTRKWRNVTEDGVRLQPTLSVNARAGIVFDGNNEQINDIDALEPKAGADITFSNGIGNNNDTFTVSIVAAEPLTGRTGCRVITDGTPAVSTESGVDYDVDYVSPEFTDLAVTKEFNAKMKFLKVTKATTGALAASNITTDTIAIEKLAQYFGPQKTVTSDGVLNSGSDNRTGWQEMDGAQPIGPVYHKILKGIRATDDSPCVAFTKPDGSITARGLEQAPSTADWKFTEGDFADIEELATKNEDYTFLIKYGRAFTDIESLAGQSSKDALFQQATRIWRVYRVGSGSEDLEVETPLLYGKGAEDYGTALLNWQSARIFRGTILGPETEAGMLIEPGQIVDVTHSNYPLLENGKKGTIAGCRILGDASLVLKMLFI